MRKKKKRQTDDQWAQKYILEMSNTFENAKDVDFVFLDAWYDADDKDQKKSFDQATKKVFHRLASKGLPTNKIQQVESMTAALKREIVEREKAIEAAKGELERAAKKLEELTTKISDLENQLKQVVFLYYWYNQINSLTG